MERKLSLEISTDEIKNTIKNYFINNNAPPDSDIDIVVRFDDEYMHDFEIKARAEWEISEQKPSDKSTISCYKCGCYIVPGTPIKLDKKGIYHERVCQSKML